MANKFVLNQEDGTVAGGNVRGNYAVDLQMVRSNATYIASGTGSIVIGGISSRATGNYSIAAGDSARATQAHAIALGNDAKADGALSVAIGKNNSSQSSYSTTSGGEANTASTNTHATVVGGYLNNSTGQYSISGGYSNVASGANSPVALGYDNTASERAAVALGFQSTASGLYSIAIGYQRTASGQNSICLSTISTTSGTDSSCIGGSNHSVIGQRSIALGGYQLTTSNTASHSVVMGARAKAYFDSTLTMAANYFSTFGDGQWSMLSRNKEDTLTTGATTTVASNLIPDGTNRVWNVTVKWTSVVTTTSGTTTGVSVGDAIYGVAEFGFKKLSGTSSITSLIRDSIVADTAIMETATLGYSVGASEELALTFTAPTFAGGGDLTMRTVAKIELVEIGF